MNRYTARWVAWSVGIVSIALFVAALIKALVVAALGIVGSFALAWLLVTRTPLRRIV